MDQTAKINIIIILIGAVQGIIITGLFFIKKCNNRNANFFLATLVQVLTMQMLLKVASKVWVADTFGFLYWLSYDMPFLYGPLLFCYIKNSVCPTTKFQYKNLLHLIPFLYILFFQALHVFMNDVKISGFFLFPHIFYNKYLHVSIQSFSVIIYSLYSLRLIEQNRNLKYDNEIIINSLDFSWLRRFSIVFLFVGVSIIVSIKILSSVYPKYSNWRYVFTLLTVFIYWISYKALSNPLTFNFIISSKYSSSRSEFKTLRGEIKYINSKLSDTQSEVILHALSKLIETEKPYTDMDLTIDELAAKLSVTRHNLSQVINKRTGKNFNGFINELRVEESKRLLKSSKYNHLTIAAIACDSGFNTISNFNTSFKKYTGLTPSQYKRNQLPDIVPMISQDK
jgi:AraC-like DNA-binding protein